MDVDTRLCRLATDLEALQRPPVVVIGSIIGSDRADGGQEVVALVASEGDENDTWYLVLKTAPSVYLLAWSGI